MFLTIIVTCQVDIIIAVLTISLNFVQTWDQMLTRINNHITKWRLSAPDIQKLQLLAASS